MDCVRCYICGEKTNGSQCHRSCLSIEDAELCELFAGDEESLPTEKEEKDAKNKQAQELYDNETYRFSVFPTSIDIVGKVLNNAYPGEKFTEPDFHPIWLNKYVTGEIDKRDFFLLDNQTKPSSKMFHHEGTVRMRVPVYFRKGHIFHNSCITKNKGFGPGGFSHGILTVCAQDIDAFYGLMIANADTFFCDSCCHFLFEEVSYYVDSAYALPSIDDYPKCEQKVLALYPTNDDGVTYLTLKLDKIIGIVYPQNKRMLDE